MWSEKWQLCSSTDWMDRGYRDRVVVAVARDRVVQQRVVHFYVPHEDRSRPEAEDHQVVLVATLGQVDQVEHAFSPDQLLDLGLGQVRRDARAQAVQQPEVLRDAGRVVFEALPGEPQLADALASQAHRFCRGQLLLRACLASRRSRSPLLLEDACRRWLSAWDGTCRPGLGLRPVALGRPQLFEVALGRREPVFEQLDEHFFFFPRYLELVRELLGDAVVVVLLLAGLLRLLDGLDEETEVLEHEELLDHGSAAELAEHVCDC